MKTIELTELNSNSDPSSFSNYDESFSTKTSDSQGISEKYNLNL